MGKKEDVDTYDEPELSESKIASNYTRIRCKGEREYHRNMKLWNGNTPQRQQSRSSPTKSVPIARGSFQQLRDA